MRRRVSLKVISILGAGMVNPERLEANCFESRRSRSSKNRGPYLDLKLASVVLAIVLYNYVLQCPRCDGSLGGC